MAAIVYPLLILLLRVSGKRTLSKMNMFDFVITIAIGSTVATILLSKEVSFLDGIAALVSLIFLQYVVSFLSVRSPMFSKIIKGNPSLIFYRGTYLHRNMKKQRVREEEIRQAIRTAGQNNIESVEAVVLETDGSLSVISGAQGEKATSLQDVEDTQKDISP